MTTALEQLKNLHTQKASDIFDKALERAKGAMVDDGREYAPAYVQEAILCRKLARRLLEASNSTLYSLLGLGGRNGLNGYSEWQGGTVSILCFIRFFVNHELMDDGYPGVGYYVYNLGFEPCEPGAQGASPYFHRCHETQLKTFPNSKPLDAAGALKMLDFYEEQTERLTKARARRKEFQGIEDEDEEDHEHILRIQLAAEICGDAKCSHGVRTLGQLSCSSTGGGVP